MFKSVQYKNCAELNYFHSAQLLIIESPLNMIEMCEGKTFSSFVCDEQIPLERICLFAVNLPLTRHGSCPTYLSIKFRLKKSQKSAINRCAEISVWGHSSVT